MTWDDAACRGRGDIDWFPRQSSAGGRTRAFTANVAAAKAVCADCPVRAECLGEALAHWGTAGIWGGTTETERDAMPRRRVRAARAACGTDSGYYRHRRMDGTEPCPACKAAHSEAFARRQPNAVFA